MKHTNENGSYYKDYITKGIGIKYFWWTIDFNEQWTMEGIFYFSKCIVGLEGVFMKKKGWCR